MNKLRLALFGLGHLGKIHLRCIQGIEQIELIGFYEPDAAKAQAISQEFGVEAWQNPKELMQAAHAVDIVTPTPSHYELAKEALLLGKHLFIEKPVTETPAQAYELLALAEAKGCLVQVGHVERFNPALLALEGMDLQPKFIEAHRLAWFNPRGTDVSVVLDLMIHDLDILLQLIPHEIETIHASGVAILSDLPDIANVRLEFSNGAVANITASRMSMKQMRKFRLFQENCYISMDFLEKRSEILRLHETAPPDVQALTEIELSANRKRYLEMQMPEAKANNAIATELACFADSVLKGEPIRVPLRDGLKALELAHRIEANIAERNARVLAP